MFCLAIAYQLTYYRVLRVLINVLRGWVYVRASVSPISYELKVQQRKAMLLFRCVTC